MAYQQEYKSRFNPQSRDERTNPPAPKTQTVEDKTEGRGDDTDLLKSIREDYKFCLDYWSYNREQAADDVRYLVCKPWTQDEIQKREGRPCLAPDEISQYIKQCTNNYRQNKRAIKVIPRGDGASDKDAERRSAIIRGIQHASNAQAAFTNGFEGAVGTGMGYWALTTRLVADGKNGEVEPRIRRIPNQFTALLDPEALEADFSDAGIGFITDLYRKTAFKIRFPDANKTSFTVEDEKMAPDWFKGDSVVVAEAWRRKKVDGKFQVTQYITNGIEILDEVLWPGSWIPIIPVLGEEIYEQDTAGQSKRVFMSLTRRMKVPQKMLCFIASQEAEEFSMAPRSPLMLWAGQEEADKKALENLNTVPRAFVKIKPGQTADGQPLNDLPGGGRLPFQPNAQAYEVSREAWRRSIQAAAGITPLPTAAQRQNEKSGIALEKIQNQEAVGSYHFTDNMDRALENTGRQLNELISVIMDTPREVSIRNQDDTHSTLKVGFAEHMEEHLAQERAMGDAPEPETGLDYLIADRGEWDVTVSTGPDYQSQREEASQFADHMIEMAPQLGMPPLTVAKLTALAIKMKDVGTVGDEMAKIIDPEDQTGAQLQQAQMQLQQSQQQMAEMQAELQKLRLEKAGKVVEMQGKQALLQQDGQIRMTEANLDRETKLAVAEITTKAQSLSERLSAFEDLMKQFHDQAHDFAMQTTQQGHEQNLASQQQQAAQQSQATDQAHQAAMAQQAQQAAQNQPQGQP